MIYNKTSKVIISIILLSLFSLNSCSFFSEKEIKEQSSQTVSDSSSNMLKLCVTPSFGDSTQENIRSAYPDFSLINLGTGKAFTAYCSGLFTESDTTGFYNTSTSQINYSIISNTFSNKEVTFYIKDSSNKKLYYAKKTISYASLGATLEPITLYFDKYIDETNPANNTNGFINLSVSTTTGYKIICTIEGDDDNAITVGTPSTTVSITTDGIEPGSYKAIISVYANSDFEDSGELKTGVLPREYEIQTINVWPGLTTNRWYLPDGTKSQTYNIEITEDKVKFWVKGTGDSGPYASDVIIPASYTADGSILKPFASLNAAIAACTSNSTDYIIKVCGTVSGNSTIGSTVYANSIAIEGVSGSSVDILDGKTSGSVLKIGKAINVSLKNIQLTNGGGGTAYQGGGLYISSGANVVLENDVLITENTAVQKGGGVYIYGNNSKLTMKPGSKITKNYISVTNGNEYGGAGVYVGSASYSDNSAELIIEGGEISEHNLGYNIRGAGVFASYSKIKLKSGKITKNKATDIGANVMLDDSSTLDMSGGEISYGEINGIRDASAAGVWINNTTSMTMSGGKICYNMVKAADGYIGRGAGVTLWENGANTKFTMTGGEISNNLVDSTNSNIIQGGAIYIANPFDISGNSYIPYGVDGIEGTGLNDIWVSNNKKITITGKLTNPASSTNGIIANITPQVYSNGTPILAISSSPNPSTTLPAESVKFNIVPDVSNPNKNWGINSNGELVVPFRIIVNDSDLYLDKSSFVTAISNSSLSSQNVKIQILDMDADDFGPAGTTGTVLYAIKNSPATKISLIVDEDANIKLPADSSSYFSALSKVVEMDLRGLDTSNVTTMNNMFYICNNLESLNLSSFNTSKVTSMQTFLYSNKLKSLDLSSFDTSNVTNMNQMFGYCENITKLDLSNFDTSNVTDMSQMFWQDAMLKAIIVSSDFKVDQVTESEDMFTGCSSLKGCKGTTISENTENISYARIDNPPDNPGYFSDVYYAQVSGMNSSDLKYDNLSSLITALTGNEAQNKNITITLLSKTKAEDIGNPTTEGTIAYAIKNSTAASISLIVPAETYIKLNADSSSMFEMCTTLISADLTGFDTSEVTNMDTMFGGCENIQTIDISGFNTSKVTRMNGMFILCTELESIYVSSSFNMGYVTNDTAMFGSCLKLKGGAGTAYDNTKQNGQYARIDQGSTQPGYFTSVADKPIQVTSSNIDDLTFIDGVNKLVIIGSLNATYISKIASKIQTATDSQSIELDFSKITSSSAYKINSQDFANSARLTKATFDLSKTSLYRNIFCEYSSLINIYRNGSENLTELKIISSNDLSADSLQDVLLGTSVEILDLTECTGKIILDGMKLRDGYLKDRYNNGSLKEIKFGTHIAEGSEIQYALSFLNANFKLSYNGSRDDITTANLKFDDNVVASIYIECNDGRKVYDKDVGEWQNYP